MTSDQIKELRKLAEAVLQPIGNLCEPDKYVLDSMRKKREYDIAANPTAVLALLDHISQMEKDAARYRWLKTQDSGDWIYIALESGKPGEMPYSIGGIYADKEIDAAIAAQSTKEQS